MVLPDLAQMATLDKAEALLEELRGASYDAAVREMEDVRAFAAENVRARLRRPWRAPARHASCGPACSGPVVVRQHAGCTAQPAHSSGWRRACAN